MLNMRFLSAFGTLIVAISTSISTAYAQPPNAVVPKHILNFMRSFARSPDEKWVVAAHTQDIRIFKAGTAEPVAIIPRSTDSREVCFSPTDPETFAIGDNEGRVSLFRVGATEPHLTFLLHEKSKFSISGLKYSPDGNRISVTGTEMRNSRVVRGVFTTRDSTSGQEIFGQIIEKADVDTLTYSHDGSELAIAVDGGEQSHVRFLSGKNGEELRRISFKGFANEILFTPDKTRLIMLGGRGYPTPPDPDYGVMRSTIGHVWIADLTSSKPPEQFSYEKSGYYVAGFVSNDGSVFVAEQVAKFELRSTTTGQLLSTFQKDKKRKVRLRAERILRCSPDSRRVTLFATERKTGVMETRTVAFAR